MAVTKWLSVRAMPRPPCRIPLPYQCYHILSAGRIAVTGRLDAALVLWPTLSWAAKGTEFPVFNQRKVVLSERCLQFVGPDTEMALRRGFDRPALHAMLQSLFSGV